MDEKESCELCFLKKKMSQNIRKHFRACQELLQNYSQIMEYANERKHSHLNMSFESFAKSPHKISGSFPKGTQNKSIQKTVIPIDKNYQQSGLKPTDRRIKEQQSPYKSAENYSNTQRDLSLNLKKPDGKKLVQQRVISNILGDQDRQTALNKQPLQLLNQDPRNQLEQSHIRETLPNLPILPDTQAPPQKKNNRRKKSDKLPAKQVSMNLKQKPKGQKRGRKPLQSHENENTKSKGKERNQSKQKKTETSIKPNKEQEQLPPPNNPQEQFSDVHCQLCDNDGSLLCCDKCPKAFHLKCVGLTAVPEDNWYCQHCKY